jgi:hypothetical protein
VACFYCGAAVRARGDDAAEHRRDRDSYNQWIELDRADYGDDENHAAAYHGDPTGQDEFALAFDPSGELIDLRLEPPDVWRTIADKSVRAFQLCDPVSVGLVKLHPICATRR